MIAQFYGSDSIRRAWLRRPCGFDFTVDPEQFEIEIEMPVPIHLAVVDEGDGKFPGQPQRGCRLRNVDLAELNIGGRSFEADVEARLQKIEAQPHDAVSFRVDPLPALRQSPTFLSRTPDLAAARLRARFAVNLFLCIHPPPISLVLVVRRRLPRFRCAKKSAPQGLKFFSGREDFVLCLNAARNLSVPSVAKSLQH